jgi:hypothetical protein
VIVIFAWGFEECGALSRETKYSYTTYLSMYLGIYVPTSSIWYDTYLKTHAVSSHLPTNCWFAPLYRPNGAGTQQTATGRSWLVDRFTIQAHKAQLGARRCDRKRPWGSKQYRRFHLLGRLPLLLSVFVICPLIFRLGERPR